MKAATQSFPTKKLLDLLSALSPATDEASTAPIKSCVVFNGRHAYADDDYSRIEIDLPTEIQFAAPLRPILGLLGTVESDTVELSFDPKGTLLVRDGNRKKDRMEIPCMEDDRLMHEILMADTDDRVYLSAPFAEALKKVKGNASTDGGDPERRGVQLEFRKEAIHISTCSDGLFWLMNVDAYANPSRNRFKAEEHCATLMPWVASTLASLFKAVERNTVTLTFHGDYLHFSFAASSVMPAVRMLVNPLPTFKEAPTGETSPLDAVFTEFAKGSKAGKFCSVPEYLGKAIVRANALMSSADLVKDFELDVLADGFRLQKKTTLGESDVSFVPMRHGCTPYAGYLRHDKLEMILPHITEMTFSDDRTIFFRGNGSKAFLAVSRRD